MLAFLQYINDFFVKLSTVNIFPGFSFNTFFFYIFIFVVMTSVFFGRR